MCGVWKIDTLRRVFRGGFFAGYSDTLSFCNGVVYVPNGALWTRYASGASGAVMVPMNTPALPACMVGDPPPPSPPPPPPAEICDGIDNNGDGVIDEGWPSKPEGGEAIYLGCEKDRQSAFNGARVLPFQLDLQGLPSRVVMEWLGHSQIGLTMNTYAHVMPHAKDEAAAKLQSLLA